MKRCSGCKKEKASSQFGKGQYRCKQCKNGYALGGQDKMVLNNQSLMWEFWPAELLATELWEDRWPTG